MRSEESTEYSMISRVNRQELLSLSSGQKCRKPVFMQVSGICFTKWLYFGSICGRSNDEEFNCNKCKYHKNIKELYTFRREEM